MRSLAAETIRLEYAAYDRAWSRAARAGVESVALDVRAHGWRYLSLNVLALTPDEARQLAHLTRRFGRLLDLATQAVLEDAQWWSELAWPWPAIELARQEPAHPSGRSTLYGRFDWLLDELGQWQLVEYNADTPSGGREVAGLEPSVLHLQRLATPGLSSLSRGLDVALADTLADRIAAWQQSSSVVRPRVGVASAHGWVEDMSQAWWLALLLRSRGIEALVGDVADLEARGAVVTLRGQPIQALYRFYPVERFYRHGIFGPVMEAAIDGRLLLLNGLRGFLAQSKAALAWLWENRSDRQLGPGARQVIEGHLPAILPARRPEAEQLRQDGVVKHVNGREGDSVVFGGELSGVDWEARLMEGGYVVQRRVRPAPITHVEVDELRCELVLVEPRYPCVGSFCVDGRFAGCYTRVDGPITTARATFVPTARLTVGAA